VSDNVAGSKITARATIIAAIAGSLITGIFGYCGAIVPIKKEANDISSSYSEAKKELETERNKPDRYNEGFNEGHEVGYNEGHSVGFDEGVKSVSTTVATTVTTVTTTTPPPTNMTAYENFNYTEYPDKNNSEDKLIMAGVTYTNGFKFKANDDSGWAVYNLKHEYVSFSGVLCHVDGEGDTLFASKIDTTLSIFFDGILEQKYSVLPDMAPINFDFNVTDVEQIKILLELKDNNGDYWRLGDVYYGIGNPVFSN